MSLSPIRAAFLLACLLILLVAQAQPPFQEKKCLRHTISHGMGYGRGLTTNLEYGWRFPADATGLGRYSYEVVSCSRVLTVDYTFAARRNVGYGFAASRQYFQASRKRPPFGQTQDMFYTRDNYSLGIMYLNNFHHFWQFSLGLRAGVTRWHLITQETSGNVLSEGLEHVFGFQFFMRHTFYFVENMGIGVEGAAGTAPYIFQAHLAVRF